MFMQSIEIIQAVQQLYMRIRSSRIETWQFSRFTHQTWEGEVVEVEVGN